MSPSGLRLSPFSSGIDLPAFLPALTFSAGPLCVDRVAAPDCAGPEHVFVIKVWPFRYYDCIRNPATIPGVLLCFHPECTIVRSCVQGRGGIPPGPLEAISIDFLFQYGRCKSWFSTWHAGPCRPPTYRPHNTASLRGPPFAVEVAWTLTVTNPTAALNKRDDFLSLDSDVLVISETSAVAKAQAAVANEFRPWGYRFVWGKPVPSHDRSESLQPSLRGLASGVAIATRLSVHAPQPALSWPKFC